MPRTVADGTAARTAAEALSALPPSRRRYDETFESPACSALPVTSGLVAAKPATSPE